MLVKPPLEALLPHVDNRYTLAVAVAKRTRQLVKGAKPMVDSESPNLVTTACQELEAGDIVIVPAIVEPVVPLRPEVEAALQSARDNADEAFNLDMLMDLDDEPLPSDKAEGESLVLLAQDAFGEEEV